jgi:uncharacterized protein (DUF1499 family)
MNAPVAPAHDHVVVAIVVLLLFVGLAVLRAMSARPKNLGVTHGRLMPCPKSPNCVSSQAEDAQHHIDPLRLSGTPPTAISQLEEVLSKVPRTAEVTKTDHYLHAEATSRIYRFVDDVEFLVDEQAGVIHCRSASRVGYSDLGVNRARIEQIRAALEAGAPPP